MSETTIAAPLSGEEIRLAAERRIERMLLQDCYLNPMLAYPSFELDIFIKIKLPDMGEVREVEKEMHLDGRELGVSAAQHQEVMKEVEVREAHVTVATRPPNVVRREAGLGVPTLTEDASGKKEIKAVKYSTAKPAPEPPSPHTAPEHPRR